jgi:hypothetical protein
MITRDCHLVPAFAKLTVVASDVEVLAQAREIEVFLETEKVHIASVVEGVQGLPRTRLLVKCHSEFTLSYSVLWDWTVGESASG